RNDSAVGPLVNFASPRADLAITFAQPPPLVLAYPKGGRVLLQIANLTNVPVTGRGDVKLFASHDAKLDSADHQLTGRANLSMNMSGGRRRLVPLRFRIGPDISGGNYFLIAALDASIHPLDTVDSNNAAVSTTGTAILAPPAPPPQLIGKNLITNGDFEKGNT